MNRLYKMALTIVVLLCVVALFAPYIASNQPYLYVKANGEIFFPAFRESPQIRSLDFKTIKEQHGVTVWLPLIPFSPNEYNLEESLNPPSRKHWLGTDVQGRDVLSRLLHGTRVSLLVGLVAVSLYSFIGVLLGAIAGFFGGKMDFVISRFIEIIICFPTFFLILTILSVMPSSEYGLINIMVVIGLTSWTGIARLTRAEFFRLKTLPFVTAAKSLGYSKKRIMFLHMLPNALSSVVVLMTFGMGSAILIESSLSFLGIGVSPSTPSWGSLLSEAREYMDFAWWLSLFPGLAIFMTIVSFHILGERLKGKT